MRVLVLGGTAFIGPAVVHALAESGHEVALFHRGKTRCDFPFDVLEFLGDRAALEDHAGDLRDFTPDAVVDMMLLTEDDAKRLLEVFRGVAGRVVAVSSMDVYRAYGVLNGKEPGGPDPAPLTEDAPLRTVLYPYRGMSERLRDYDKILVERVILGDGDLPGAVLRLPMVYGPRDYQHRLYPYLKRMDDGRPAVILSDALASWTTTRAYVEDAGRAVALAAEHPAALGRVYNVGEAAPLTELEWAQRIAAAADWEGRFHVAAESALPESLRPGMNTAQSLAADTSRIRDELGYSEVVEHEEGLRRTVEWERANPPKANPTAFDYAAEDAVLGGA